MTFVLVAMVMTVAPVDVWVDVASGAPCVTKSSLESSLSSRGVRVGKGELSVRVGGSASQLVLTANRGAQKFERVVPVASGDCEAVSRVAVALISSWATPSRDDSRRVIGDAGVATDAGMPSGSLRVNGADAGVATDAGMPNGSLRVNGADAGVAIDAGMPNGSLRVNGADAGVATDAGTPSGSLRANAALPAKDADVATNGADAGTPNDSLRVNGADADAGVADADATSTNTIAPDGDAGAPPPDPLLARIGTTGATFTAEPTGVVEPASPLSLDIIALGGIANDPLSTPESITTGIGQLALRGAIGRWGLLIDGGFDSSRTRSIGEVTATASSQWLSLSLSVAFRPLERFSLDLALGIRGWRFGGSATGVDGARFQRFLSLGGVLSAGFNYQLVGPLHVQLRPWLNLRGNRGAFLVENLGTLIPIEPLTFGALLGAMLRFD